MDAVLWGDDGLPLALNESKRTKRDPRVGQQQAKLYADCLEKQFGQRPIIFYSNGYEHWIWDATNYPPRPVQGFYKKAELELLIQRRKTHKPLAKAEISQAIIDRYYQIRGVRRIGEAFEVDHDRKTLVVMATGGGKTRLVIALNELLMRCNWVKRALFLDPACGSGGMFVSSARFVSEHKQNPRTGASPFRTRRRRMRRPPQTLAEVPKLGACQTAAAVHSTHERTSQSL